MEELPFFFFILSLALKRSHVSHFNLVDVADTSFVHWPPSSGALLFAPHDLSLQKISFKPTGCEFLYS